MAITECTFKETPFLKFKEEAMPTVIQYKHLPTLLSGLGKCLPQCIKVFKDLQSFLAGNLVGVQFVADRWPNPRAVVEIQDASDRKNVLHEFLQNTVMGVCGEQETLFKLLTEPGLLNWNVPLEFYWIPDSLWEIVQRASVYSGGNCSFQGRFYLLKTTLKEILYWPVPDGLQIESVHGEWVNVVNSAWKFRSPNTYPWVKFCTDRFPSAVLLTHSRQHVGHAIVTTDKSMGLLHVRPEFRNQGLAKVIVSNLAKKCFDHGEEVFGFVEESNLPSLKAVEDVGFKRVPHVKFSILLSKPKEC